jgi:Big-like domain-containing protein
LHAPYTSATVASGADGARAVTWVVFDNRGNRTTASRTVIVDNTPPAVAFRTAPKNGAKLSKTAAITATASDRNGIARVQLLVNGTPAATAVSGYAFTLRPAQYGKRFTVQLRAYDRAGNTGTTNRLTYGR